MDFVITCASPSEMMAKLSSMSLVKHGENTVGPVDGVVISYIGYNADQTAYSALLRVPEDGTFDLELIKTRLASNFNYADPPLRIILGGDETVHPSWEAIKYERDRRKMLGGYEVNGKWFHSDTFSRTQQLGMLHLGDKMPPGIMWKTMDGSFVELTPTLAQQIFAAAAAQDVAIFRAAEVARAAIAAMPEKDQGTFDMSAIPWPPIYQPK